MTIARPILLCLALAALGGCTTAAPETAPVALAANPAPVAAPPSGNGCAASVARTQAVVDGDIATGDIDAPVGTRFGADLGKAAEACAAGREAEGLRLLAAAKTRYGYR